MTVVIALAVVAVLALGVVVVVGGLVWGRATSALHCQLEAARRPSLGARYDERELEALPAPVQRYLRQVLTDGQPVITAVTLTHRGEFNLSETGERWRPFTSHQRVITQRPGFVWNASVSFLPGVRVRVHDAYVTGEGLLRPTLFGLFALFELRGPGDVAQGEFMRFFAETAWYPTALLPSQGVRWEPIDEHSARATMVDGSNSVTLDFRFGPDGLMTACRAAARARTVGKTTVMTPWEGRWSNYQVRDGMKVPLTGEVAWLLPGRDAPYWKGTVEALGYEF